MGLVGVVVGDPTAFAVTGERLALCIFAIDAASFAFTPGFGTSVRSLASLGFTTLRRSGVDIEACFVVSRTLVSLSVVGA